MLPSEIKKLTNTKGKTVTVGKFWSNTTTARTLTLGASIINVSYFSIYGWDMTPGTNLTLNSGTSTHCLNLKARVSPPDITI